MLSRPVQLKIQTRKPKSGQGGKARGGTARNVVDYLKDVAAAEYYAGGQAESTSLGSGWQKLDIDQATDEQLLNLLNGYGPDGEKIAARSINKDGELRVGYDLTFSPPKDFSIIAEFGDADMQEKTREIERRAISAVAQYIEESGYVVTRSGKGGKDRQPASNLLFQANYHQTNRENDPQRHTHLVLMNLAQNEKGKWQRIEAKGLYSHTKELGAVYRAEVARGLVEAGFAVERDKESFKIVGASAEIRDHFSGGSRKIKELLGDGVHSSDAKQKAALKVRSEKTHKSRADLESSWDEQLSNKFQTDRQYYVDSVHATGRNSDNKFAEFSEDSVISRLNSKAVFSERDLKREIAIEMAAGAGGAEDIKAAFASFENNDKLVKLKGRDGLTYYTTKANRENEIEALKTVAARQGQGRPVSEESFKVALEKAQEIKGFNFTAEQIQAVKTITQGPSKDRYIQGVAGAGKTTLVLAVRLAYEQEGRKVIGAALAGKAAAGLADAGIETSTIDSLLLQDSREPMEAGSLLVIDEASMIDTAKFRQLIELAEKRGVEIAWIGDSKQLQSIQAGSIFYHLFERSKPEDRAEIKEAARQKGQHAKDFKEALGQMRDGNSRPAFDFLEKLGGLKVSEDGQEIKDAMDYWQTNRKAGIEDKNNIIVTNANSMKKRLNDAARLINGQAERSDNVTVRTTNREGEATGTRQFAPGDRVMTLKNQKLGGVNLQGLDNEVRKRADKTQNGTVWTIDSISESKLGGRIIKMTNDSGQSIKFNTSEYSALDHAYAFTVHQSQGISAKAVTNLASSAAMTDKHSAYVMLSRSELAERTAFVVPKSMIEERELMDGVQQNQSQSIADQMQSFIDSTQRERIDHLSITLSADSDKINAGESEDIQMILKAFPEQVVAAEQNTESVSAEVMQTDQGNDLDFYEQMARQGQDDRQSIEDFERKFEEDGQATRAEYEMMAHQESAQQGRGRTR